MHVDSHNAMRLPPPCAVQPLRAPPRPCVRPAPPRFTTIYVYNMLTSSNALIRSSVVSRSRRSRGSYLQSTRPGERQRGGGGGGRVRDGQGRRGADQRDHAGPSHPPCSPSPVFFFQQPARGQRPAAAAPPPRTLGSRLAAHPWHSIVTLSSPRLLELGGWRHLAQLVRIVCLL